MQSISIKSQKHHWWPCSLQRHWASKAGMLTKLRYDGRISTARCIGEDGKTKRTNFCQIRNGHLIIKEGFWANTIEPQFEYADTNFSKFISELIKLRENNECRKIENVTRDLCPVFTGKTINGLSEFVGSLVVRSPNFRNKCVIGANQYRPDTYQAGPKDALIAVNIGQTYKSVQQALERPGLQFIAYTDKREFIFGDGFFSSAYSDSRPQRNLKLVVPLTPHIAFLNAPTKTVYSPGIRLIKLGPDWVEYCNSVTQIYSKNELFFSNERPEISEQFQVNEHLEIQYHRHELLEYLSAVFG